MRYRIRNGEIIYELIEPDKKKDLKKGVIVFSGLPNQPRNEDFGDNLAKEGFTILQPRYIGSWESYGKFSMENCIKTVLDSIELFSKKKAKECWAEKEVNWDIENGLYLLSSSFGSAVVLSSLPQINKDVKSICLCPLIDLDSHGKEKNIPEQNLEELFSFLEKGFENVFRGLTKKEWKNFVDGKTRVNPVSHNRNISGKKILLIHGNEDKVVNISKTKEFYKQIKEKNDAELKIYENIGHGKDLRNVSFDFVLIWMKEN